MHTDDWHVSLPVKLQALRKKFCASRFGYAMESRLLPVFNAVRGLFGGNMHRAQYGRPGLSMSNAS
ncbi:MAG: hypothetical protein LBS79_08430 [Tannerella sp.]|nr:hypothetical protein [Tannerella sp.]